MPAEWLEGLCHIFVPHTTAAVTINEKADPAVARDIEETLAKLVPEGEGYSHAEGNADAHVKSALVGVSAFFRSRAATPSSAPGRRSSSASSTGLARGDAS